MSFDEHLELHATDSPTRWRCTYSPFVLTQRGNLQGGAGLAISLRAAELVTGRPAVWATAQYLAFAAGRDPVDVDVSIEVEGHQTTQARCVLSRHGREVLTAHVALGAKDFGPGGTWVERPLVPPPDACAAYRFLEPGKGDMADITELRLAYGRQLDEMRGEPGGSSSAWWCRVSYGRHVPSVGELAFVGDLLPVGFSEPYGRLYSGTSIDNTLRIGTRAATGWILLDCRIEHVSGGYGAGRMHLWSEDGALLATASQTVAMRLSSSPELETHKLNRPTV